MKLIDLDYAQILINRIFLVSSQQEGALQCVSLAACTFANRPFFVGCLIMKRRTHGDLWLFPENPKICILDVLQRKMVQTGCIIRSANIAQIVNYVVVKHSTLMWPLCCQASVLVPLRAKPREAAKDSTTTTPKRCQCQEIYALQLMVIWAPHAVCNCEVDSRSAIDGALTVPSLSKERALYRACDFTVSTRII